MASLSSKQGAKEEGPLRSAEFKFELPLASASTGWSYSDEFLNDVSYLFAELFSAVELSAEQQPEDKRPKVEIVNEKLIRGGKSVLEASLKVTFPV